METVECNKCCVMLCDVHIKKHLQCSLLEQTFHLSSSPKSKFQQAHHEALSSKRTQRFLFSFTYSSFTALRYCVFWYQQWFWHYLSNQGNVLSVYLCSHMLLPVWRCPPHDCWCSVCCRHFPELVDSEYSSIRRWSFWCVYLGGSEREGQTINTTEVTRHNQNHKQVSVQLCCVCILPSTGILREVCWL